MITAGRKKMRTKKWSLTLALILMISSGLGSSFGFTAANIISVKVGKDKGVTRQADSFGPQDTVYATAQIANVANPVDVKAQLFVEDIPGQQPGPINGLAATVKMVRNGTADFSFSAPTKGWPKGRYGIEVVVLDEHGETMDHKGAEFTVD
jgi:hypothetical protein